MGSPTQRSLARLRKEGHVPEVVERYNTFTKQRKDLYGFIDIVSVKEGVAYGIQTTSYSNMSARIKKIRESELFPEVAKAFKIIVHGWRKNKSKRWELVEREVKCEAETI